MILVKIHKSYRQVVAVCDLELYGKKILEGEKQLDLTGQFFKGEEKTEEETKEILIDMRKEDASFNIVGQRSCDIAISAGLIDKEAIFYVSGVPFSLVLL
jgi:hypothetical protein